MTLPRDFLDTPIAHRGLHNAERGIVENSRAAFQAAIDAGHGIELDVQFSRDAIPMVFHDYELHRLTACSGPVRERSWTELADIGLRNSHDRIERLDSILEWIGPRAPVLIEIKDQSGLPRADLDAIDQVTGQIMKNAAEKHGTRCAVMSFNPQYIANLRWLPEHLARGLTTTEAADYPDTLPQAVRDGLARISAFGPGMSFVSHNCNHLDNPRLAELKQAGAAILCWTVRSVAQERIARKVADNITFEGYLPT